MPTFFWFALFLICLLATSSLASTNSPDIFHKPAFSPRNSALSDLKEDKNETNYKFDIVENIPEWKQRLPYPLNNKTKTLQRIVVPGPGGRTVEIYLLGTAHVSIDSSRDVELLLSSISPHVVFLELCDQRIPMLISKPASETKQQEDLPKETKRWWQRRKKRQKISEESSSLHGMAASMLTSMQQDYADSLGVELGGEFRTAYDYWEKHRTESEVHMILGDRPLYLTLTRAWESLGIWGKTKLLVALFISSLQKPNPDELREWIESILADDSGDILTKSIDELKRHFPTLEEVIIRERDAYMACKLYQTCRQLVMVNQKVQTQRLVAIVGAGHVQGMCHWLTVGNGKSPEAVLADLIEIKNAVPKEDAQILTSDVMAVNHELLQAMIKEMQ
jgi:pheromone shutdown protein TraB